MQKTNIIAIRHAKPASPADYPDDRLRPLVDEGRQVQRQMAKRLVEEEIRANLILTSPFLRAQQTADILVRDLGGEIVSEPALGVPFDGHTLLAKIPPGKTTLLVGHDPTLANFVNQLIGEAFFVSGMAKSGAAIITFSGDPAFGQGRLIDYLEP